MSKDATILRHGHYMPLSMMSAAADNAFILFAYAMFVTATRERISVKSRTMCVRHEVNKKGENGFTC